MFLLDKQYEHESVLFVFFDSTIVGEIVARTEEIWNLAGLAIPQDPEHYHIS